MDKDVLVTAGWRAFKTLGQSFFGTLGGAEILIDATFTKSLAVAGISACIAAGLAFFTNLNDRMRSR